MMSKVVIKQVQHGMLKHIHVDFISWSCHPLYIIINLSFLLGPVCSSLPLFGPISNFHKLTTFLIRRGSVTQMLSHPQMWGSTTVPDVTGVRFLRLTLSRPTRTVSLACSVVTLLLLLTLLEFFDGARLTDKITVLVQVDVSQ